MHITNFLLIGDDEDIIEEEYDPTASSGSKSSKGKPGANKEQFKGHLNGLYDGLAKIMTSTVDIDAEEKNLAPLAVEKAVHNIMFIKHHMKRQDEFDAVSSENILGVYKIIHQYYNLGTLSLLYSNKIFIIYRKTKIGE